VSPRPHDTGMVTMISQNMSEFELHARALMGLPIPLVRQYGPSASAALVAEGHSSNISYSGMAEAITEPDTAYRIFGKPEIAGHRRMAVGLALGKNIDEARAKARNVRDSIKVTLG